MASKWKTSRTMDPGQRAAHTAFDRGMANMVRDVKNRHRAKTAQKGLQKDPGQKTPSKAFRARRARLPAYPVSKGYTLDPGQRARRKK